MKQRDIKPCLGCGKPPFHDNQLVAFGVSMTGEVLNLPAVRRQAGLEMMLGGNALIANVMGPDEDMTKALADPAVGLVCMDCAVTLPLAEILERTEKRAEEAKTEGR